MKCLLVRLGVFRAEHVMGSLQHREGVGEDAWRRGPVLHRVGGGELDRAAAVEQEEGAEGGGTTTP
jgi:hypothetical protein